MSSKKLTTINRVVSLQFNQISESQSEHENQTALHGQTLSFPLLIPDQLWSFRLEDYRHRSQG
jgi:hypothetical protein